MRKPRAETVFATVFTIGIFVVALIVAGFMVEFLHLAYLALKKYVES